MKYDDAVQIIKAAILQSQYDAARAVNEKQLTLYYGIGKYISLNSRKGFWGKGAIDAISDRLQRELPGLRGFTSRNLRYMRTFYEEWTMIDTSADVDARHALTVSPAKAYEDDLNLAPAGAKLQDGSNLAIETAKLELASSKLTEISLAIWNLQVPNSKDFPQEAFLHIGFTHHRIILRKVKSIRERLFYIRRCAEQKYSVEDLEASIARDDYGHQGSLPNNFPQTLSAAGQALRAINAFKDEYLCKDMNKSFVDYVIQDYSKPMGVATYKTAEDMPEKLRKALPDVEDLRRILDGDTKGAEP
jgi:predicted nuclease of restriction endonuclease-like (RecB) superfamily